MSNYPVGEHAMMQPNLSGLCMCGCGRYTPLARRPGLVAGEHRMYCTGHAGGAARGLTADAEAKHMPTEHEISAACDQIRRGWTAATLQSRGGAPAAWVPPLVPRKV